MGRVFGQLDEKSCLVSLLGLFARVFLVICCHVHHALTAHCLRVELFWNLKFKMLREKRQICAKTFEFFLSEFCPPKIIS